MARSVNDIKRDLDEARARVEDREAELFAAKCDIAGVHVGDVIEIHERNKAKFIAKVATVQFWEHSLEPRMTGYKRKKNGEWYQWPQHVYGDWELVERGEAV